MAINQTHIRLMEISTRLTKIHDRVKELRGEKITLLFKMEQESMHPILFKLKLQAMDFEIMLLDEEVNILAAEYEATKMVAEIGIDFECEDF